MGQVVLMDTFQAGALQWHLLGMSRSSRRMPGTTRVSPCQNGALKLKEQWLYLWQCPPTWAPFV